MELEREPSDADFDRLQELYNDMEKMQQKQEQRLTKLKEHYAAKFDKLETEILDTNKKLEEANHIIARKNAKIQVLREENERMERILNKVHYQK